ncbi:bifunctional folylpolyglutamate synthase/dihydrofolate synthase [Sphingomonas arenae]|uniref:bifunctional folylpolyglutamate synthase/dihydrofolate synthase n=1 Tax=Sphingomonas arenae TaxID=2812555 RepID=UPI001967EDB5|nr:folylpolyglutamate synthase/dihydrofolate synthase family protein [Sphingomonas arenae]
MADKARSLHPGVQEQLDRLAALSPGGDRLGLERITALLDRLGRPHDELPPVFHVAGTNGKGSTCAFLRAALEAAGYRVHVFTSPHLVRFNERIRLTGALIGDERLATLLEEVLDASGALEPSFFEVTTAAAFLAFARTPADAVVLEVGMGGRLDATNVIDRPLVCGIAALGIDHQQWLGKTLAQIGAEKAGIAKDGVPLVTQAYQRPVSERIAQVAAERGARWLARGRDWDAQSAGGRLRYRDVHGSLALPQPLLPGRHQAQNAALAVAMLRHQHQLPVSESALSAAMGWAEWPARFQRLHPGPLIGERQVWLDGGHNAAAARALAETARQRIGTPLHLVVGCLTTKDPKGLLEPFLEIATSVSTVPVPDHDCFTPEELAGIANGAGMNARAFASVEEAVAAAPADVPVLIAGSLYLAGEVLRLNDQAPV